MSTVNWVAIEYLGTELCTKSGRIIKDFDDLHVDDLVNGWWEMIIKSIDKDTQTAIGVGLGGNMMCFLEFNKDERHCWIHATSATIKAVEKLVCE